MFLELFRRQWTLIPFHLIIANLNITITRRKLT
jgi:hypothetical protein